MDIVSLTRSHVISGDQTPRTQHALARDDDLLRLFFDGQGTDERGDFFGGLPLRELTETLLAGPDAGVNDLQEQLA